MKNSDPFTQKVKQVVDQEPVDEEIKHRLRHARQQALQSTRPRLARRYGMQTLAIAAVAAVAIALTLLLQTRQTDSDFDSIETFEIITSVDDLDMYENLDFYLWLEQELETPQSSGERLSG